ncbi:MAG TPA: diguanylate cyclase [Victivallales bacterium]|nr:diguanylate cyclase [Victivallales bacterium]
MKSPKQKILLVDDNESVLNLTIEFLKDFDIDIITSTTGENGIKLALNNDFDLILMDINLPDINGFDAVKSIREHKDSNEVPICFLTGKFCDDDSLAKGLSIGADDYLTIPVSATVIRAKVKNFLEKQLLLGKLKTYENELEINNQQLEDLLYTDSLTGAVNKNPFIDMLNKSISKWMRFKQKFALLFLDFDGFKSVNDKYGHMVGDEVLKASVSKIKSQLRQYDIIGRFAGDEFLICLNDIKTVNDIIPVAAKINKIFDEYTIYEGNCINLGVSIGIAIFPDDSVEINDLICKADAAMYHSKKLQKNAYCFCCK